MDDKGHGQIAAWRPASLGGITKIVAMKSAAVVYVFDASSTRRHFGPVTQHLAFSAQI